MHSKIVMTLTSWSNSMIWIHNYFVRDVFFILDIQIIKTCLIIILTGFKFEILKNLIENKKAAIERFWKMIVYLRLNLDLLLNNHLGIIHVRIKINWWYWNIFL